MFAPEQAPFANLEVTILHHMIIMKLLREPAMETENLFL